MNSAAFALALAAAYFGARDRVPVYDCNRAGIFREQWYTALPFTARKRDDRRGVQDVARRCVVLTPYLLIAAADGVPKIDVNRTCRMSAQGSSTPSQDLQTCITAQNSAREELTKEWRTYSAADRQRCTSMAVSGYFPSYVELIVCLQISRDLKNMPEHRDSLQAIPPAKRRR